MNTFTIIHYPFEKVTPRQMVFAAWPKSYASMEAARDAILDYVRSGLIATDNIQALLQLAASGISWFDAMTDNPLGQGQDWPDAEKVYALCGFDGMAYVITKTAIQLNHDNVTPLEVVKDENG